MDNDTAITEKSTSEDIARIFPQLTHNQLRFVVAMVDFDSKRDAALAIGLKPNTVYRWSPIVDEAIQLVNEDVAASALQVRKRNLLKAMLVKVTGLDSGDEAVRQKAATELIEWELGKAAQRQEITGAEGGPLVISEIVIGGDEG